MAPPRLYRLPNEQLADLLYEGRALGLSFEDAWSRAVRPGKSVVMSTTQNAPVDAVRWPTDRSDRLAWQAAINASKEGFRRAFERRPMTAPERAVALLADGFRALDRTAVGLAAQEGIGQGARVASAV